MMNVQVRQAGRFISKTFLFLLVLMFIDHGLARLLDSARPKDYRQFIESKYAYDSARKYDIIFFGDSHIADGCVPSVFRESLCVEAFNFGVYHMAPIENYYLAKDVLSRGGSQPKVVVLGTNPQMFTRQPTAGKYTPFFIRNPFIKAQLLSWSFDETDLTLLSEVGRRKYLLESLFTKLLSTSTPKLVRIIENVDNGYLQNVRHMKKPDRSHNWGAGGSQCEQVSSQVEYFSRTIAFLKERGIGVLVVHPPMYLPVYLRRKDTTMFQEWKRTIDRLCREHNVPIYDPLNEFYLEKFTYDDFLNGEHLCYSGAVKFSRDLALWIKTEWYEKRFGSTW
jgi:hypothetical protein